MSDLISRGKLLGTIEPMVGMWDEGTFWIDYKRVIDIIESLPSAEPERKKGKWKWISTDYFHYHCQCSECEMYTRDPEPNFCPWCGADMRGEYERRIEAL